MTRPTAPPHQLDPYFRPAFDLEAWARHFIEDNPDHAHLAEARVCFLWTNVPNERKGRGVAGEAQLGQAQAMGRWARAKAEYQQTLWFGETPDFLITVDANWWAMAGNLAACALVEHELYHCAQDKDVFGMPKFNRLTGKPAYTLKGHDVEEFVGVVRRYGATSAELREMVDAIAEGPSVPGLEIARICGNCSG